MVDELALMKQVAKIDETVVELMRIIREFPERTAAYDAREAAARAACDAIKQESAAQQKRLHERELFLRECDTQVQKLDSQLNTIKKNDEYQLMRGRIAELKIQKSAAEEEVLGLYEVVEAAKQKQHAAQAKLDQQVKELAGERAALLEARQYSETRLAAHEADKHKLLDQLSPDDVAKYRRLLEHFEDMVIVALLDNKCQGCHMRVTPQAACDAMNGKLVTCQHCGRLMYYAAT